MAGPMPEDKTGTPGAGLTGGLADDLAFRTDWQIPPLAPSYIIPKEMEQQTEPPPIVTPEAALVSLNARLGRLILLQEDVVRAEQEVTEAVQVARDLGATWAQIAQVAGVKPQSAYQRWNETGREKHRGYQRKRR